MKCNLTLCSFVQLRNNLLGSSKEIISYIKYINLSNTIQCSLYQDCSSCSAGTQKSHLLSDDVHSVLCNCSHKSNAICCISSQYAIVIDNRVARTGNLGSRRYLVSKLTHDILARHGNIPSSGSHCAETLNCFRHLVFRYIKRKICIIQPQLIACFIVHFR